MNRSKVAIIGTGMIGSGWIRLFARAGFDVMLHDANDEVREAALGTARTRLRNELVDVQSAVPTMKNGAVIRVAASIEAAVDGACYVQESIPEDVTLKRQLFESLDRCADDEAILASSSSSILPDHFLLTARVPQRCIVAHPFSPPDAIPLVEVVPSSRTSESTVQRTLAILRQVDREPITLRRPVVGYAVNRFQALLIAEGLHLVAAGVLSPEDVDKCLKFGLGRRWCFIGPFETMDLNSRHGFKEYVQKFYGTVYRPVLEDMYPLAQWPDSAIEQVEAWRRQEIPTLALDARRAWRDDMLMRIAELLRPAEPSNIPAIGEHP